MAGEEKTEKATPKKRKDAREKEGNVLQSKEISTVVTILGIFLALSALIQFMYQMLCNCLRDWITKMAAPYPSSMEDFTENAVDIAVNCVLIVGPIVLIAALLGILPVIVQTRGLFTMKPLKPKFSKLNPLTGIKRLFSIQSLVGILKGIIEIVIIVIVVYFQIMGMMNDIKKLPDMEVIQGAVFTASSIYSIIITICIILVFVAAADFLFQWWQFEKKLKMSKQEVKDEWKQVEGDPQIKSKIKQKQREIAQNRMMQEVPEADVVVRNPTHYAVALKYNPEKTLSAPQVIAKGKDILALKIIEIAEENKVYVTEDRPLARMLYETVDIGKEIPPELFAAVSAILLDMYEAKGITLKGQKTRKPLYN